MKNVSSKFNSIQVFDIGDIDFGMYYLNSKELTVLNLSYSVIFSGTEELLKFLSGENIDKFNLYDEIYWYSISCSSRKLGKIYWTIM